MLFRSDSLLKYTPIEDPVYSMTKSTRLIMLGKTDEALDVASACYQDMLERGDNTAIITHVLSEIYEAKGDLQMQKYYLLLSALEDIHDGKNEYISLRRLAVMMYEKGDINRAYNYMKCSMEDAIYCNARLRALEITRLLPIINGAYDVKSQNERTNLISFKIGRASCRERVCQYV